MKKPKQYSFLNKQTQFFGGALLEGKRKLFRPLSSKDSIHFVLRSSWATGRDSFLALRNKKAIDHIIKKWAQKFGVKIYEQAITSNHIHLLLMITNRRLYRAFIKAVAGLIASHVMGQQSFWLFSKSRRLSFAGDGGGEACKESQNMTTLKTEKSQGFWQFRPFSRVVNWGRDFKTCTSYLKQNVLEALGFIPYTTRKKYYAKWLIQTVPHITRHSKGRTSKLNKST